MTATVHHPNCVAVKQQDARACTCGGSAFPIPTPADPNADLIGFQYQSGIETVTVLGSASWSSTYVQVRYPSGFESIQRAELVRAKKEASDDA